jgi:hypothetical protein
MLIRLCEKWLLYKETVKHGRAIAGPFYSNYRQRITMMVNNLIVNKQLHRTTEQINKGSIVSHTNKRHYRNKAKKEST